MYNTGAVGFSFLCKFIWEYSKIYADISIKYAEISNQHAEILNQHAEILIQCTEMLNQHAEISNQHAEILNNNWVWFFRSSRLESSVVAGHLVNVHVNYVIPFLGIKDLLTLRVMKWNLQFLGTKVADHGAEPFRNEIVFRQVLFVERLAKEQPIHCFDSGKDNTEPILHSC